MSLSQKIADALADQGASPSDSPSLSIIDGRHRLTVNADLAGPVGVRCQSVEFAPTDRSELSPEALLGWGNRLVGKLSYLMEPLRVLEADDLGGEVLLRSQSPTIRDGRSGFYEVRLDRSGTARLGRVSFDESDRRRKAIPFQLSGEVLERLADDLVASAC